MSGIRVKLLLNSGYLNSLFCSARTDGAYNNGKNNCDLQNGIRMKFVGIFTIMLALFNKHGRSREIAHTTIIVSFNQDE